MLRLTGLLFLFALTVHAADCPLDSSRTRLEVAPYAETLSHIQSLSEPQIGLLDQAFEELRRFWSRWDNHRISEQLERVQAAFFLD